MYSLFPSPGAFVCLPPSFPFPRKRSFVFEKGHLLAPMGGCSIDFCRMDKVIRLNKADHDVTVQPGLGAVLGCVRLVVCTCLSVLK